MISLTAVIYATRMPRSSFAPDESGINHSRFEVFGVAFCTRWQRPGVCDGVWWWRRRRRHQLTTVTAEHWWWYSIWRWWTHHKFNFRSNPVREPCARRTINGLQSIWMVDTRDLISWWCIYFFGFGRRNYRFRWQRWKVYFVATGHIDWWWMSVEVTENGINI